MPAEWEPHEATWLGWPHNLSDWPGRFAPIPWVYGEIVRKLAEGEIVRVVVPSKAHEAKARRVLERVGAATARVEFFRWPTDRGWTRDFGPICVRREHPEPEVAIARFRFNGWARYNNWKRDNEAGWQVAGEARVEPEWNGRPMVLEGGSIDVNGQGLLLTTEECLLSEVQQRNPGMTREQYEAMFDGWLGARQTIWLGHGIAGDDTHGHVDDLARFTAERTVALAVESNRNDPNYALLRENLKRLRKVKGLTVVELPMPRPVFYGNQRLPASYANFYIANKQVLVPQFNDPNDRIALNTLKQCFPSRDVIGVYCTDLVLGQGTLHCITMQQPA